MSVNNQLTNFNAVLEDSGNTGLKSMDELPVVDISIRDWREGTKKLLKERTSYKHRLEMMAFLGAEPVFVGDF